MLVPVPTPVAQVIQRGPAPRVCRSTLELERSVGPKEQHSYSTATKLRVIHHACLRRPREKPWSGDRAGTGAESEADQSNGFDSLGTMF